MRIYVAGPLSTGDVSANVRRALAVATRLLDAGHAPFVPHLSHFWDLVHPRDYERWMALDIEWLSTCDALVRIPGPSAGADREVARCEYLLVPVYDWRFTGTLGDSSGWAYRRPDGRPLRRFDHPEPLTKGTPPK